MLTERQELVLRRLVQEYLDAGRPRGLQGAERRVRMGPVDDPPRAGQSRGAGAARAPAHVGRAACPPRPATATSSTACCPSTPSGPALSLSLVRRELDEAMRVTTETLSQVTNLLAIVTAPPIETSTIRHVEVLALQPQVLMVVVITSTGGVTKRLFTLPAPGRHRPGRLGRQLSQRAPGRARAGRADAAPAPARSRALGRPRRSSWRRSRRCSPSSRSPPWRRCTSRARPSC